MIRRLVQYGALGCTALVALLSSPHDTRRAVLAWNASASAPLGLYRVMNLVALERGELVLVTPPRWVQEFASARGYLPANVPLIKRIAALGGDTICAFGRRIFIDGNLVTVRLAEDSKHRPLPGWSGCLHLDTHEVFLLMANVRDSFDGRYFGPVQTSQILGRAVPLWTW